MTQPQLQAEQTLCTPGAWDSVGSSPIFIQHTTRSLGNKFKTNVFKVIKLPPFAD